MRDVRGLATGEVYFMNTLKKGLSIALVFVIGILSAEVASATATYHWQEVYTPPNFEFGFVAPTGTITVDDAALRGGFLNFDGGVKEGTPPGPFGSFPSSPIIQYQVFSNVVIMPRQYMGDSYPWSLAASLSVDQETGLMVGLLSSDNLETGLSMSSGVGGLWTVNRFVTDADFGGPCGGYGVCSGATGRWVLYAVPEPSEIPMFIFGLILIMGLGLTRRFNSTHGA